MDEDYKSKKMYLSFSAQSSSIRVHALSVFWKARSVEIYNKIYIGDTYNKWRLNEDSSYTFSYQQARTHYEPDGLFFDKPIRKTLKESGHIRDVSNFCEVYSISQALYRTFIKSPGDTIIMEEVLTKLYSLVSEGKRTMLIKQLEAKDIPRAKDVFYTDISEALTYIEKFNLE